MMRPVVKLGAVAVVFMIAYVAYVVRGERLAAAKAAAFCSSVAIGADSHEVLAAAQVAVEKPSRAFGNDEIVVVMFVGPGFWFRHSCHLKIEAGRVVSKGVESID